MKGFGLGLILSTIVKFIFRFLELLFTIIASLLLYFGLWIPVLYLAITGIFMLLGGIDLNVLNTNTVLFYIGLVLSLIGSVVITIRHLIIKPLNEVIKTRQAKNELKKRRELLKEKKLYQKDPAKYFVKYEGGLPHPSHPVYYQSDRERREQTPPLVYRSNVDPSIIVHEYSSHFEVFREYPNGKIVKIDIKEKPQEIKDKKKSKWKKKK